MGNGIIFIAGKERMESGEKKHLKTIKGNVGKVIISPSFLFFAPTSQKKITLSLGIRCGRRMEFRQVYSLALPKKNAPLHHKIVF